MHKRELLVQSSPPSLRLRRGQIGSGGIDVHRLQHAILQSQRNLLSSP